jgi:concanavalin A-like lectin/glucanase superfamily protein
MQKKDNWVNKVFFYEKDKICASFVSRIMRACSATRAVGIGLFSVSVLFPLCTYAGLPTPSLYLSFDRKFQIDGAETGKLKSFPDSPFHGVAKAPAGKFVAGVSGKAFIPHEALTIQGEGIFPAPEGTISLWIKPVKYKEDWIGGPALTTGRIGAFLSIPPWEMKGKEHNGYGGLAVRKSRHDCCSGLHWVESWGKHYRDFSYTGPNALFIIWQKDKWRMLTVVWFKGERRIYFNGVRIQHGTDVKYNPSKPGGKIIIPAGSKAVDELMIWDLPLTDAQVAALFFSKMPQSGLKGAVQLVPQLSATPDIGKAN